MDVPNELTIAMSEMVMRIIDTAEIMARTGFVKPNFASSHASAPEPEPEPAPEPEPEPEPEPDPVRFIIDHGRIHPPCATCALFARFPYGVPDMNVEGVHCVKSSPPKFDFSCWVPS